MSKYYKFALVVLFLISCINVVRVTSEREQLKKEAAYHSMYLEPVVRPNDIIVEFVVPPK